MTEQRVLTDRALVFPVSGVARRDTVRPGLRARGRGVNLLRAAGIDLLILSQFRAGY